MNRVLRTCRPKKRIVGEELLRLVRFTIVSRSVQYNIMILVRRNKMYHRNRWIILSVWVLVFSIISQTSAQSTKRSLPARKTQSQLPKVKFATGDRAMKIPLEI